MIDTHVCSSTCQWDLYPECLDLYRSTQRGLQDDISITTNGSNALMIRGGNLSWNAIDTNGNISVLDGAFMDSGQYGRISALDDRHFVITYRKDTAAFPFTNSTAT